MESLLQRQRERTGKVQLKHLTMTTSLTHGTRPTVHPTRAGRQEPAALTRQIPRTAGSSPIRRYAPHPAIGADESHVRGLSWFSEKSRSFPAQSYPRRGESDLRRGTSGRGSGARGRVPDERSLDISRFATPVKYRAVLCPSFFRRRWNSESRNPLLSRRALCGIAFGDRRSEHRDGSCDEERATGVGRDTGGSILRLNTPRGRRPCAAVRRVRGRTPNRRYPGSSGPEPANSRERIPRAGSPSHARAPRSTGRRATSTAANRGRRGRSGARVAVGVWMQRQPGLPGHDARLEWREGKTEGRRFSRRAPAGSVGVGHRDWIV